MRQQTDPSVVGRAVRARMRAGVIDQAGHDSERVVARTDRFLLVVYLIRLSVVRQSATYVARPTNELHAESIDAPRCTCMFRSLGV